MSSFIDFWLAGVAVTLAGVWCEYPHHQRDIDRLNAPGWIFDLVAAVLIVSAWPWFLYIGWKK